MPHKKIIQQLLAVKNEPLGTSARLTKAQIIWLCQRVRNIFLQQPILLELQPPLTVCGDVHGQYHDLLRIFDLCGPPPTTNYLFLGDYVDRGCQSIESVCLLFAYKIAYPENFFMLRGNHECSYVCRHFGFYDECLKHYDVNTWRFFCDVFNCLPLTAVIDDKIFCVHGGISPGLGSIDEIAKIQRPFEVPESGLVCDLLWSDPSPDVEDWDENERGTSYTFGQIPLNRFLDVNGFDLVCRAHQIVSGGYDFPFKENQGMITVFSAPNYCYECDNKGAVLQVNEDLDCSFQIIEPKKWDTSGLTDRECPRSPTQ